MRESLCFIRIRVFPVKNDGNFGCSSSRIDYRSGWFSRNNLSKFSFQRHFSARWLHDLKIRTGAEPENAAMVIAAVYGICLLQGEQAQFLANCLLIAVPLLLTYVYPKERPSTPLLLIYWACLAVSTLFDRIFAEGFTPYYIVKIAGISLLFLRPVCGAQKILEFLEKNKLATGVDAAVDNEQPEPAPFNAEELHELEKAKHKKSPPPEKPEGESKPLTCKLVRSAKPYRPSTPLKSDPTQSVRSTRSSKSELLKSYMI